MLHNYLQKTAAERRRSRLRFPKIQPLILPAEQQRDVDATMLIMAWWSFAIRSRQQNKKKTTEHCAKIALNLIPHAARSQNRRDATRISVDGKRDLRAYCICLFVRCEMFIETSCARTEWATELPAHRDIHPTRQATNDTERPQWESQKRVQKRAKRKVLLRGVVRLSAFCGI